MKQITFIILLYASLTLSGCVWVPPGPYHDEPRRGWHHEHWHDDAHWH